MALKAFLYSRGHQREAIHSIQELVERCERYAPDFAQFRNYGVNLDPFYLETRYPDALDGPEAPFRLFDRQAAEQALSQAEHIFEYVQRRIRQ